MNVGVALCRLSEESCGMWGGPVQAQLGEMPS